MNVLVTNAKNRIAYNIVRSLAARGHRVFCADFVAGAMSFYSRYSTGHFLYPSPFREQEAFIDCLIDKIKELEIDVLIPVYEELFLVAKHKEKIEQHVKMAVPGYNQILLAHNKDQWEPIARKLKIPVPRSHTFEELNKNPFILDDIQFPLLIKPKQGGGGWGMSQVGSLAQLQEVLYTGVHNDLPLERFFVQEIIGGQTLCVAMVFSQGQLRGKTSYRQIREYPVFRGQATCRISVANSAAEDSLQRLLEHIKWHGVCQADFIIDSQSETPYLIDINPRFWGSLAQGVASGVDFPHLVCDIAFAGDTEAVVGFKEGVRTRWLGGELRGFFQHYRMAESKSFFLADFFSLTTRTALYDDFNFSDPIPFLAWGWGSFVRFVKNRGNSPHDSLSGVWR